MLRRRSATTHIWEEAAAVYEETLSRRGIALVVYEGFLYRPGGRSSSGFRADRKPGAVTTGTANGGAQRGAAHYQEYEMAVDRVPVFKPFP